MTTIFSFVIQFSYENKKQPDIFIFDQVVAKSNCFTIFLPQMKMTIAQPILKILSIWGPIIPRNCVFSEGYRMYLALCLTELVGQLVSQLVSAFLFFKTHMRVLLDFVGS